mgnify:CR=1 FL=1
MNNNTELSVNTEVIEKIAEIAAKQVEGVTGLSKRAIDLKGAVKSKTAFKGIKVESVNGAVKINAYICVKKDAHVKDIAEKVQQNIKDKIQVMTSTAVTKVNVVVADIEIEHEETEE